MEACRPLRGRNAAVGPGCNAQRQGAFREIAAEFVPGEPPKKLVNDLLMDGIHNLIDAVDGGSTREQSMGVLPRGQTTRLSRDGSACRPTSARSVVNAATTQCVLSRTSRLMAVLPTTPSRPPERDRGWTKGE